MSSRTLGLAVAAFVVVVAGAHLVFWPRYTWVIAGIASVVICLPYLVAALGGPAPKTSEQATPRGGAGAIEKAVATLLIALSIAGAIWWPGFVIAALFGHGLWDLIKHARGAGVRYPGWYEVLCVAIDWGYAAILGYLWVAYL